MSHGSMGYPCADTWLGLDWAWIGLGLDWIRATEHRGPYFQSSVFHAVPVAFLDWIGIGLGLGLELDWIGFGQRNTGGPTFTV